MAPDQLDRVSDEYSMAWTAIETHFQHILEDCDAALILQVLSKKEIACHQESGMLRRKQNSISSSSRY